MAFTSLRNLLPGAARRAGITRDLAITDVLRACQAALAEIFGPEYGKFAEAVALQPDGALVITCRSPAVAQTVRLREEAILTRVRAAVTGATIARLFLIPRSRTDAHTFGAIGTRG